ncbi:hypothetical protein, partial [Xanthomonas translucens]
MARSPVLGGNILQKQSAGGVSAPIRNALVTAAALGLLALAAAGPGQSAAAAATAVAVAPPAI